MHTACMYRQPIMSNNIGLDNPLEYIASIF